MTETIRVIFDDKDGTDQIKYRRMMERMDDFRAVIGRGMAPWSMEIDETFSDPASVTGKRVTFYVNEFYEGVVMDLIEFLDANDDDWNVWFRDKYAMKESGA